MTQIVVSSGATLRTLRILLVDDQPTSLQIMRDMLKEMGAVAVVTSTTGQKALDMIASSHVSFDVVLCDWRMPEMSGLDLLRAVRAFKPDLPFFMVTGAADVASVLAAKESGVSGYIKKPFSADELRKKLHVVARIKAHREA